MLIALVAAAVLGAACATTAWVVADRHNRPTATATATTGTATVEDAARTIGPSVVTINVLSHDRKQGGTGSGIVLSDTAGTAYILTNNHVVSLDSATNARTNQITITLSDGASSSAASIAGTDTDDDLAVVKVPVSRLPPAVFDRSSTLIVGQSVVAVGAPLGLSNTVTSGIVSALARPVATGTTADPAVFDAIQTDAAINPGNSGGALIDLAGHVVGVNSAIAGTGSNVQGTQSGSIGIGFAIPADEAVRIADQLIATGHSTHAVLGIDTATPTAQTTQTPTSADGATITAITPGGSAAHAGLRVGDSITQIGPQRIDDSSDAIAATRANPPGATVNVTITRNGTTLVLPVTLGSIESR